MLLTKMILDTNEIIKKEILPRKSFFFNTTEKLRIVFSLFYLAVSFFLLLNSKKLDFFIFQIIAVIMFCSALYISFFRWIFKYFKVMNNCYLITNQRIIIANKTKDKIIKYKKLNEIDEINAEMSGRFFGNIIFGEPEGVFGRSDEPFSLFNRSGMSFKEDEYAFLSVENINEIIPVFEELGLKVTKTFY